MSAADTSLRVGFDVEALMAQLRKGDAEAIDQAYHMTFRGALQRLVLTHFLAHCGVGQVRGPERSEIDRAYADGRADAALELMTMAGFDQAAAVVMTVTETLEGQNERHHHDDDGGRDHVGDEYAT